MPAGVHVGLAPGDLLEGAAAWTVTASPAALGRTAPAR